MSSYISISQSNDFLKFHDFADDWNATTEEEKQFQLDKATKQINRMQGLFQGIKKGEQANFFPRSIDLDIPEDIKEATAELAIFYIVQKKNKKHKAGQMAGLASVSLDGVSFSYNGKVELLSYEAYNLLSTFFIKTGVVK